MRVLCRHGHYAFYPRKGGDLSRFCKFFNIELDREADYYTFPQLVGLPRYSLAGKLLMNLPATETFEGSGPWDVLEANRYMFHLGSGLLLPKSSIAIRIDPPLVGDFFLSQTPLIQAGSMLADGSQVISYSGEYAESLTQLRVSEFSLE